MRFLSLLLFIIWFSLAVAEPSYNEDDYNDFDDYSEGQSFLRNKDLLWKNGSIPFIFQDHEGRFTKEEKAIVYGAMKIIESQLVPGCINFTEVNAGCDPCLKINKANNCKASIGLLKGNPQMKVGRPDCLVDKGKVLHELCHSLGLVHEQTRPDRDDYIDVNDNLIDYSAIMAWKIKNVKFGETYETPYDFFSIMHYPISLGCKENRTCATVKQPYQRLFTSNGQKLLENYPDKLSPVDLYEISSAYRCPIYSFVLEQYINYIDILRTDKPDVNIFNENCLDKCETKAGTDYHWCKKYSTRYEPEIPHTYCSYSQNYTHLGQECITECSQHNGEYFSCNVTGGDWGFCSPQSKPDIHKLTVIKRPECTGDTLLTDDTRSILYGDGTFKGSKVQGSKFYCDSTDTSKLNKYSSSTLKSPGWVGPAWYRMPAGTPRIPESSPGVLHCGTQATGWLSGVHPTTPGASNNNAKFCFHWGSNDCAWSTQGKVTNCGSYFVYYLENTVGCRDRYCATN